MDELLDQHRFSVLPACLKQICISEPHIDPSAQKFKQKDDANEPFYRLPEIRLQPHTGRCELFVSVVH